MTELGQDQAYAERRRGVPRARAPTPAPGGPPVGQPVPLHQGLRRRLRALCARVPRVHLQPGEPEPERALRPARLLPLAAARRGALRLTDLGRRSGRRHRLGARLERLCRARLLRGNASTPSRRKPEEGWGTRRKAPYAWGPMDPRLGCGGIRASSSSSRRSPGAPPPAAPPPPPAAPSPTRP